MCRLKFQVFNIIVREENPGGEGKFLEGTVLVFKLVLKAERSSGRVAILR
jgi:hypothetical protein